MKFFNKRNMILELKKLKLSISKISKIFNCCNKTIYNWEKENISKIKRGRHRKISEELENKIIEYTNEKVLITQQEIREYIFKNFNIEIHQSNISRFLKRKNISYKKVTKKYSEKKISDEEWLKKFKEQLNNQRILAMDECSFVMNEHLNYGYSFKNKRAYISEPGARGQRYNLILCISNDNKIIKYFITKGSTNTEIMKKFFKEMKNEKGLLILDNASFHRSKDLKESIKDYNFKNYYLPPYSPTLNPTEFCFGIIKHYVRKERPRNYKDLEKIILQSIEKLQENNKIENLFKHCLEY